MVLLQFLFVEQVNVTLFVLNSNDALTNGCEQDKKKNDETKISTIFYLDKLNLDIFVQYLQSIYFASNFLLAVAIDNDRTMFGNWFFFLFHIAHRTNH